MSSLSIKEPDLINLAVSSITALNTDYQKAKVCLVELHAVT